MSSAGATLIGFSAIVMWSLLAALTAASGPIPPFQMNAMCFAIGALAAALAWVREPARAKALRQPPLVWLHGVAGLFGYHALYFAALRIAPPAEASLVNYLWPLLIVVFSSLLPGERLRGFHIAGALLGFVGVAALSWSADLAARPEHALGYALAFAAALFWEGIPCCRGAWRACRRTPWLAFAPSPRFSASPRILRSKRPCGRRAQAHGQP